MNKFIKLTKPNNKPIIVNVDTIVAFENYVYNDDSVTLVFLDGVPMLLGSIHVTETIEEIIKLINE